ncbi:MAG: leucyl aminopeptidase [Bacteriovoracales bacterium]|nr:leucyl aminopeptidase [Bacteriovoracales bacterium]
MNISLITSLQKQTPKALILGAFAKEKTLSFPKWPVGLKDSFRATPGAKNFTAKEGSFLFYHDKTACLVLGLGHKKDFKKEALRQIIAKTYKGQIMGKYSSASIHLDSFEITPLESIVGITAETLLMSDYRFDKYLSKKDKDGKRKDPAQNKTDISFLCAQADSSKVKKALAQAQKIASSINKARDFVNEPPNILRSHVYAKEIEKDVKSALKGCGVRVKIMGKQELKKEKMNLFLSVNAGSAFDPRLVHLTYSPKKTTKKTKHIVLVGKGLVFDTGGYSLKPPMSMINMKYDMAGSATVYGAFRAAALLGLQTKLTCLLGITDNAVNSSATMPDSIVKARNGKTVEILNTDAEGRLVLADCLDYACDQRPDYIIDAATLTGAVLVALGHEVCGLMGNDKSLMDRLLDSAKKQDEYMWALPIIDEFKKDIKSQIADLRNIGNKHYGGSAKAGAFLSEFVRDGIPWAHLDIAGVAGAQKHLPYCPSTGASGLMVRSLVQFIRHVQV